LAGTPLVSQELNQLTEVTMGFRLSKIYTRTGDKGETGLGDGRRVPKDHPDRGHWRGRYAEQPGGCCWPDWKRRAQASGLKDVIEVLAPATAV
jgi:hypothetical protein